MLLVERFFGDRAQGDLATFLSFLGNDAEADLTELDRPYAAVYTGREQLEMLFKQMAGPWREVRFTTTNPLADGDNVILDVERVAYSDSSFGFSSTATVRVVVRAGKIVYWKLFLERADALTAAASA